jgi:putative flippase GtrA
VSGVAIGIYYAIYTPLTRYLDVYDLLALGTAIIVGMLWNFSVNFLWTWRKRSRQAQSED